MQAKANPTPPIPVTLLTGFLGAGKTTVLNTLLRSPDFAQTVVIVNEFGEIGLDAELIVAATESMVLLQAGCMCCTLRGDVVETLKDLRERQIAGEVDFARIVIETTGLADPAPILITLMTSPDLGGHFLTDGIITVVDAVNGPTTLRDYEEARHQVALADAILLTKTDLDQSISHPTRQAIADLNPSAPIFTVTNGTISAQNLIGLGHFPPHMSEPEAQKWLRIQAVSRPTLADLAAVKHLDAIRSVSWTIDQPLKAATFDVWMDFLMARRGQDILRFKAIIHVEGAPCPYVIHGVQHIFHPPVPLPDWNGQDRRSKLVLIVRDFTDPEIRVFLDLLSELRVSEHTLPAGYLSHEVSS